MIDIDVRILLVVNYDFGEADYSTVRILLAEKAWDTVRAGMRTGYYLETHTFPRWINTDGMMMFAPIQSILDLTRDACVCYQINESPITDWISTDALLFSQRELHRRAIQNLLSNIFEDSYLDSLFLWIGECVDLPPIISTTSRNAIELLTKQLQDGLPRDFAFQVENEKKSDCVGRQGDFH